MKHFILPILAIIAFQLSGQELYEQQFFSEDGKYLFTGGKSSKNIYDQSEVKILKIYFKESNYWQLLKNNYNSKNDLMCRLVYEDVSYDSVGIRFKGQTSYKGGPGGNPSDANSEKKSFNISLDAFVSGRQIKGFQTLNLNNSFADPSFMREVFYYDNLRNHCPAAKSNFVHLFINDLDWGIYQNVQQLNKDFLKEWWPSNDGTNWRADSPSGSFGGNTGPNWGDGTAALNYLGQDSNQYKKYYTLKSSSEVDPWQDLIEATEVLNKTTIENLPIEAAKYFDLDRILWHLAGEVLFADDDSYIYKGKMDYCLYKDLETGRISLFDYDGNSILDSRNLSWSPFYNESKVNYPLMNKLLKNKYLRQRYLAHLRTLINEYFDPEVANQKIDNYASLIDLIVKNDTKKTISYEEFKAGVEELKSNVTKRRTSLLNNAEVKLVKPAIQNTVYSSSLEWQRPLPNEAVVVSSSINHPNGIKEAKLYYGEGLYGIFNSVNLNDEGINDDKNKGDNIYSATIPGKSANTFVRFYIEAIANNSDNTIAYYPEGAEHDVMIYQVMTETSMVNDIVINEFMASNENGPKDATGKADDWVELYNKSNAVVDLGGFHLSDNIANTKKWLIPAGVKINALGYLIFWCDEDQMQGLNHTSFKLSGLGETIILSDKDGAIIDSISFRNATKDKSFARKPNGTGPFFEGDHTFNFMNTTTTTKEEDEQKLVSYPNPVSDVLHIRKQQPYKIINAKGQAICYNKDYKNTEIKVANWQNGLYLIIFADGTSSKITVLHQ
ncbi:MAG: hypothetical protein RLZZ546_2873 [Bacteroidota bacterium]